MSTLSPSGHCSKTSSTSFTSTAGKSNSPFGNNLFQQLAYFDTDSTFIMPHTAKNDGATTTANFCAKPISSALDAEGTTAPLYPRLLPYIESWSVVVRFLTLQQHATIIRNARMQRLRGGMYTDTKWSFVRDANQKTAMQRVTVSSANYDILWIDGIAKSSEIFVRLPRFERTTKDGILLHGIGTISHVSRRTVKTNPWN